MCFAMLCGNWLKARSCGPPPPRPECLIVSRASLSLIPPSHNLILSRACVCGFVLPSSSSLPRSLCIGADRDSGGGQQHHDDNSSSPDAGSNSSAATAGVGSVGSKLDSSIVPAQRRRRRRLNDRLYALRSVVPNITKVRVELIGSYVPASTNRDVPCFCSGVHHHLKF